MFFNLKGKGSGDIISTISCISLPLYLAKSDIRQRYRRSVLGPFWITISTAVMVACLGFIFSSIFKASLAEFLPFIATGLITWGFISSCVTESTAVFSSAESIIKQLPIPLFSHVIRMVARNFYIFLHNLVILPFVLFLVGRGLTFNTLFFFPGISLLILNLLWFSLILGIVCTRYRDLSQIVINILQIFFYITPIIWLPSALSGRSTLLVLDANPFFHLMEIVRAPIMGHAPTANNWLITVLMCIIGWLITVVIFNRYKTKIAYWL